MGVRNWTVLGPALGVEPPCGSDSLQQRRLTAAVLPDDEGRLGVELQCAEFFYGREGEGVGVERGDAVSAEFYVEEVVLGV